MIEEKYIRINSLSIATKIWHPQNTPTILALHGWLDNAASFDLLAPLLSKFRVIALDLPGHGLSDHLPDCCTPHFVDAIPFVFSLADSLGLKQFALLGHSMGAGIASLMAGTVPERISHLALIEGLGPLIEDNIPPPLQLQHYLHRQHQQQNRQKRTYPSLEAALAIRAKNGVISEKLAKILALRGTLKTAQGYQWRHDSKLNLPSPLRLNEDQAKSFIQHIKAPVCLITAQNGFNWLRSLLQLRLSYLPHIKHHQILGGHHVHMESPENVASILNEFFLSSRF